MKLELIRKELGKRVLEGGNYMGKKYKCGIFEELKNSVVGIEWIRKGLF